MPFLVLWPEGHRFAYVLTHDVEGARGLAHLGSGAPRVPLATLPQDFTLFELVREPDSGLWREKASWMAEHRGLVNVLGPPGIRPDDEP